MFPTPPSLEQHPAFSPIMTYRDTPSQEPPAPSGAADHLPPFASTQLAEYRMEMEEGVASPRQDDIKVRGGLEKIPLIQADIVAFIALCIMCKMWIEKNTLKVCQ